MSEKQLTSEQNSLAEGQESIHENMEQKATYQEPNYVSVKENKLLEEHLDKDVQESSMAEAQNTPELPQDYKKGVILQKSEVSEAPNKQTLPEAKKNIILKELDTSGELSRHELPEEHEDMMILQDPNVSEGLNKQMLPEENKDMISKKSLSNISGALIKPKLPEEHKGVILKESDISEEKYKLISVQEVHNFEIPNKQTLLQEQLDVNVREQKNTDAKPLQDVLEGHPHINVEKSDITKGQHKQKPRKEHQDELCMSLEKEFGVDFDKLQKERTQNRTRVLSQFDTLVAKMYGHFAQESQKECEIREGLAASYQCEVYLLQHDLERKQKVGQELRNLIDNQKRIISSKQRELKSLKEDLVKRDDTVAFNEEHEKAVLVAKQQKEEEFKGLALKLDKRERDLRDRDFTLRDKKDSLRQRKEEFEKDKFDKQRELAERRAFLRQLDEKRFSLRNLFKCRKSAFKDETGEVDVLGRSNIESKVSNPGGSSNPDHSKEGNENSPSSKTIGKSPGKLNGLLSCLRSSRKRSASHNNGKLDKDNVISYSNAEKESVLIESLSSTENASSSTTVDVIVDTNTTSSSRSENFVTVGKSHHNSFFRKLKNVRKRSSKIKADGNVPYDN